MKHALLLMAVIASWYNYSLPGYPNYAKYNLTAASRDYPRNTMLQVCTDTIKKTCVVVRVNDYGPDPVKHPDRGIDLSQRAFKELAPLKKGLTKVTIKRYEK